MRPVAQPAPCRLARPALLVPLAPLAPPAPQPCRGWHRRRPTGQHKGRQEPSSRLLLVDLAPDSPLGERIDTIRGELEAHTAPLERRPWVLVGTKLDAVADREAVLAELTASAAANGVQAIAISAVTGEGVDRLVGMLFDLVEEAKEEP